MRRVKEPIAAPAGPPLTWIFPIICTYYFFAELMRTTFKYAVGTGAPFFAFCEPQRSGPMYVTPDITNVL